MREKFYNPNSEIEYGIVLETIQKNVKEYIINNNLNSLVIGISGGIDSALNASIISPICKELGINLIGRYIHIESNTDEERERAVKIGNAFCSQFNEINLTDEMYNLCEIFEEESIFGEFEKQLTHPIDKIRRGNIKARMRMMYLYNLAHKLGGIVIDNDNMTEYLLGFYTLNGGGDISPLFSLLKTEVYGLAKFYANLLEGNEKESLQCAIDAVPTDGLGITSSDVEQFGVKTYDEVDDIIVHYYNGNGYDNAIKTYLYPKYGKIVVDKVISRIERNKFKRNHPFRILL